MRKWNHQQIAHSYYSWALDLEMTPFWTARSLPIPTALQSPELPFSSTNLLESEKKTADSVCVRKQTSNRKFAWKKKAKV